jgi:hypothetical protein
MNPQLAEQLRTSMEQFTEHVEMPSGLARSAYRRLRRRHVMTRAAAAAAAAAVVVVGAAVAITVTPGHTAIGLPRNEAFVVLRVENALTAVGQGDDIAFTSTIVTSLNSSAPAPGVPYRTDLAWNTRDRFNEIEYTSSGSPFFSLTVARVPGGLETLTVQYAHRVVIHQKLTGAMAAHSCSTAARVLEDLDLNPDDLTNWPVTIHALIGCGLIRPAGHQRAGGVDLIRFVQVHVALPYLSMAVLVNPSTFLPSRMVVTFKQPGQAFKSTTEFGSLPPTSANLAHLYAPEPAGFTQSYQRSEAASGNAYANEFSWMFMFGQ